MNRYYQLLPSDGALLPCLFKETINSSLVCRSMYSSYACGTCGRIDAGAALRDCGIHPGYDVQLRSRHLWQTFDYMIVIDNFARAIIDALCDDVCYYEIPRSANAFVVWPKRMIVPDDTNAFSRSELCSSCNVYRSTVFGPEPIPRMPDVSIGAVLLEAPQGPNLAWFVNHELAKRLKKARVRGLTVLTW